ncbi:hypothetical protein [Aquiflexum gelatinilyticum]|uniref:hypothetical protein n=1 Tax=Aquiflexum gelatinilyticum TaxID=2961943 RepID=UPI0021675751|nr:hypothetical protein [Aquiflexum gelatinilyticum]MCS4434763.1 hypothetical protein [Aquiflexum gelatinilyticum]
MQALIITPTPHLSSSIDFYLKLGFKQISEKPICMTDGKSFVEINPERYSRSGFKFFKETWKEEIKKLESITKVIQIKEGYLISDGNGVWIYLIERIPELVCSDKEASYSVLGNYMGISLESIDPKKSFEIYQAIGFELVFGTLEGGFFSLANHGFTITLMKPNSCPHLFFNPSLTYFNGKNNPEIISKIRTLKIPITEEITYFNKEGIVDNIIIRDPGGLGFFIFND